MLGIENLNYKKTFYLKLEKFVSPYMNRNTRLRLVSLGACFYSTLLFDTDFLDNLMTDFPRIVSYGFGFSQIPQTKFPIKRYFTVY